jgi:hypothetical protein
MGGPSPEQGRGNRHQLQTDTTQNSRKTIMDQSLPGISFAANRTVVKTDINPPPSKKKSAARSTTTTNDIGAPRRSCCRLIWINAGGASERVNDFDTARVGI